MSATQLVILLILAGSSLAGTSTSKGQEVLNEHITLVAHDRPLKEILREIEGKVDVNFAYKKDAVASANGISIVAKDEKLSDVLDRLLKPLQIGYEVVGKQIILTHISSHMGKVLLDLPYQESRVTGTVTSEDGEPVPGVNVLVKGTTNGTTTDSEGKYTLAVFKEDVVLVFSFIGYGAQEVALNGRSVVDISLKQDVRSLDEVVIVGYGVQKKVNLTGAVEVIDGERLDNRQAATVSQILQGLSPGLNFSVDEQGFQPGASMSIDIRGMGSINGGSPLVIIDGFPGDMDRLNPSDIESVSILKDAAASAIYGARAPYGVILITTKSGKKNEKLTISYSGNVFMHKPARLPEMLDSYTFARVINEMGDNGGGRPYSDAAIDRIIAYQNEDWDYLRQFMPADATHYEAMVLSNGRWGHNQNNHANYDWYDEYYGHSVNQKHDLSIRGGSEKTSYYMSAGSLGQEGVLNYGTDTYKRYNLTGKINTAITEWLDIRYETRFMKSLREYPTLSKNWDYQMSFRQIARTVPTQAKYDGYGNYSNQSKIPFFGAGLNLFETTENWQTLAAEVRPLKGWKINGNFAYRNVGATSSDINLTFYEPYADGRVVAQASSVPSGVDRSQDNNFYWSSNIYTSYGKTLNEKHNLFALLGVQYEFNKISGLRAGKTDLIVPDVPSLQTALGSLTASENLGHWSTQGYFGRLTYNFDEKYLLEGNVRYDGTSRFQEGNRWGFFPSFSLGWNIFKESFWEPVEQYVNTFKVRASWGQLGNQQVSPYLDLPLIPFQTRQLDWIFQYGQTRPIGYTSTPGLVSPNLTWETSTTKNIGANLSFLGNRLQTDFDLFERVTENMIGPSEPVPGVLGSSVPSSNNATLRSRGWEVSLRWNHDSGPKGLSYFVNLNLHDVKTVVTDYLNPSGLVSSWYPGKTAGEIWGYTAHDLFKSQEEVDAYLAQVDMSFLFNDWNAGDLKYEDINGDGEVNAGSNSVDDPGDLSIIGNSTPRYQFGVNAGFSYKGFDFSFLIKGTPQRDYSIPNRGEQYVFWGVRNWLFTAMTPAHLDYFRDQPGGKYVGLDEGDANVNLDAHWPRLYLNRAQNIKNRHPSTRYLLDASYLRLQNVQLGYSLPLRTLEKIHLQRLRVYISGENLVTLTSLLKGIDPIALGPANQIGMTYGADRIFSFGINASL